MDKTGNSEEQKAIQALYKQLDQSELASVSRQTILSVEDIRQEALLICWTICTGSSDFDPNRGSLRQYVMGRLWSLRKRYAPGWSIDQDPVQDSGMVALRWIESQLSGSAPELNKTQPTDPLDHLLNREIEEEKEKQERLRIQKLVSRLPAADRTWARLILSGASHDSIADLSGMTRRGGRYRFQRLIKQITAVTTPCE